MFAPLPANVAAMGNVSAGAGAQSALAAAMSASTALSAATSASALAGVSVSWNASTMLKLTALAGGIGTLKGALKMPLTGANCGSSLEQLANALSSGGLMNALGGLPMSTLSPLQSLAQLAGAMSAASALGVNLMSAGANAQLAAMAKTSASAAASASSSAQGAASATAATNAAAFVSMSAAVQTNLGIGLGVPGGIDMLGAQFKTLNSNLPALNALNGLLNAALLTQTLALLNALSAIKGSTGINMLTAGAGFKVQPTLKSLAKSAGVGAESQSQSAATVSKSTNASKSAAKSVSKSAQVAASQGLGNLLSSLPVLPPATLLFAYLLGKLMAQLGVGMVQTSACGPLCAVPALPCQFSAANFAQEIAAEGLKLQAPKLAFEAAAAPKTSLTVAASSAAAIAPAAVLSATPPIKLTAVKPSPPSTPLQPSSAPPKLEVKPKKPPFPGGPKKPGGSAAP